MVADYFVDAKDQELEGSALTPHASSGANSGNVNMSLEQKGKGLEASPAISLQPEDEGMEAWATILAAISGAPSTPTSFISGVIMQCRGNSDNEGEGASDTATRRGGNGSTQRVLRPRTTGIKNFHSSYNYR